MATGLLALPAASADPGSGAAKEPPAIRLKAEPGSSVRAAEVPVTAATRGPQRTSPYSMLGLTWRGADPASMRFRSHGERGWGAWRTVEVLEDGPSTRAESNGRRASEPVWVGPSDGVQVDVRGAGHRDLRLVLIDPGVLPSDRAAAASPGAAGRSPLGRAARPTAAPNPPLLSRKAWGADPSWRNGGPRYNPGLRQIHVHHTASSNSYTRADVPAIIRGMYRYHTASLGWFDLGYNFVVDRFGRAWVGRSGGPRQLVRGAHTLGFNHNSVGIAVIGNYEEKWPTKKAVTTVVALAAWKLDRHRRQARGMVSVKSEGSDRFPAGRAARLPVIDGHRDTNDTACPGKHLYDRLPSIRSRAQWRIDHFSPR